MPYSPELTDLPASPPGKNGCPWTVGISLDNEAFPEDNSLPRISIVTISYNQAAYLEETIRSVLLLQGYPNLEYIIVDGGSTDGSLEIIQKYAPWLSWLVSEPDRGQSHAINKGFERCTGEIITFLSSDDIYLPGALLDVGRRWHENFSYGAIIGSFVFQDESSQAQGQAVLPYLAVPSPVDLSLGPPGIYRLHQVSTFYNRRALDAVGRWVREDMKYVMDRELLYRVCRTYPLMLVDTPYGAFRKHPESKSISAILPFAEEFARLYLLNLSGEKSADRKRRHMARYRLSRGYAKYAGATKQRSSALWALVKAAFYDPANLLQPGYFAKWLKVLRG